MNKTQTFFGKEGGEWADKSSLDMGFGKGKKTLYAICTYCQTVITVSERTVGTICKACNNYYSIDKHYSHDEILKITGLKWKVVGKSFHMPDQKMITFRDGMEKKAYDWRDKQIAKQNESDYKPRYHGPLDIKTGEHAK